MLYVVVGDSGEYSDWSQWIVCAYENEALAREHAQLAEAEYRIAKTKTDQEEDPNYTRQEHIFREHRRYDSDRMADPSTPVNYTVHEVDLRVSLPEPYTPSDYHENI